MVEIVPGLYLGSRESARDRDRLRAAGITHIVNCAAELSCYFEGEFVYRELRLHDPDPALVVCLPGVCAFIDEGLRSGKVLVHCFAAVSRSPAVVLAYLCHLGDELEAAARKFGRIFPTAPDRLFLHQIAEQRGHALSREALTRLERLLLGERLPP
jgi:hypothetical protein